MRTLIARVARYGAVSIVATVTSLTVLGVLVSTTAASAGWANVIATLVGTVPSFELNRRWVWGRTSRRSFLREVAPFALLSFAGLVLSTGAVTLAAHWAVSAGVTDAVRTLTVELANVTAFGSLWVLQFVLLDRVLFTTTARRPAMLSA